jgi:hypothetical protein
MNSAFRSSRIVALSPVASDSGASGKKNFDVMWCVICAAGYATCGPASPHSRDLRSSFFRGMPINLLHITIVVAYSSAMHLTHRRAALLSLAMFALLPIAAFAAFVLFVTL